MQETLTCLYSCSLCKLDKVELLVPVRREDEDVRDWMQHLGVLLRKDHNRRSPQCQAKQAQNLMIPMTGRDYIGGPIKQ